MSSPKQRRGTVPLTNHCRTITIPPKGEAVMLRKVRVNPKTGVLYIPKELLRDGFKGDMDALVNAMTFTLIHPEADLEKVRKVLKSFSGT